jgi:methionine-gamma-lyase
MKFSTRAIHEGHVKDKNYGSHVTPIYQTGAYVFDNAAEGARRFTGEEEGYIYSRRIGNPNSIEVGKRIASLEGAEKGVVTSSGMAAITTVLMAYLKAGDNIITTKNIYGTSYEFVTEVLPQYDIGHKMVDLNSEKGLDDAIDANTKVIYFETPSNPTLGIIDIEKVCKIAKKNNIIVVVDNTFMTPYLQRPIEHGADIVIHSASKYLCGHGDVIAGIIVGKGVEIDRITMPYLKDFGGYAGAFTSWLLMRGIKTLSIRVDKQCDNAMKVANYLEKHNAIKKVFYPGLDSFEGKDVLQKQADGYGAMIAFEMKDGFNVAKNLMDCVAVISLAVSLGAVDSLIEHPASMTHSKVPKDIREGSGITDGLVRMSVGIEDAEDIIMDLENAINKAQKIGL